MTITLTRYNLGAPALDFETWDTTEAQRPIFVGNPGVELKHGEASA